MQRVLLVVFYYGEKQIVGDIAFQKALAFERKYLEKVFGENIGDNVHEIMPHVIFAISFQNGKRGNEIQVTFFERNGFIRERKFGATRADIVQAHVLKIVHHAFPLFAYIEIGGFLYVEFCRLKEIIKIQHDFLP